LDLIKNRIQGFSEGYTVSAQPVAPVVLFFFDSISNIYSELLRNVSWCSTTARFATC